MFIKVLEYDYCNGVNKKSIMDDKELIKLNNEILLAGDSLTTFTIPFNENKKTGYDNPKIKFVVLSSDYDYKCRCLGKDDYNYMLFDHVRMLVNQDYLY